MNQETQYELECIYDRMKKYCMKCIHNFPDTPCDRCVHNPLLVDYFRQKETEE